MQVQLYILLFTGIASSLECGVFKDESRIVGGKDVDGYKYPWYAAFQHNAETGPVCAGSLITSRIVLTAAHCYYGLVDENKYTDMLEIVLGMVNHCNKTDDQTSETFKVIEVILHEKYDNPMELNDIAIVRLDREANFVPICLPPKGDAILHVDEATIMGFGLTIPDETSSRPCVLQEATITIFTNSECHRDASKVYKEFVTDILVRENIAFCAGIMKGRIDTCQGDSGGPILTRRNNRYVQEGLVSFGFGCANPRQPGVYTHVSSFIDWLNEHIPEGLPESVISPKTEGKSGKNNRRARTFNGRQIKSKHSG